jgi:hypothetical protein
MKALSIQQPWAWAVLHAGKDIENRAWNTSYRGELLIHAGKSFDYEGLQFLLRNKEKLGIKFIPLPSRMLQGGIVGVCTLDDVFIKHASPWFFGKHGFLLSNPKPVPFKTCPGKLKLFDVEWEPNGR